MLTGLQKLALLGLGGAGLFLASRTARASSSNGLPAPGTGTYDPYTGTYYDPNSGQYVGGYDDQGQPITPLPGTGGSATTGAGYDSGGNSYTGGGTVYVDRATQSAERWASPVRGTESIWRLQNMLFDLGYDPGPLDGRWGTQTRNASVDLARSLGVTAPTSATAAWITRVEDVWAQSGGPASSSSSGSTMYAKGGDAGGTYDASTYEQPAKLAGLDGGRASYDPRAAIAGTGRYARRY